MRILSTSESDLLIAADALTAGKLVALPTETVYGLGANAYDPAALARVFEAKRRPAFDPLIVHIASLSTLETICDLNLLSPEALAAAGILSTGLWPGPLTLILPKKACVSDLATSGLPTVAVRFPSHPVARKLIELSTGAIAAPSANPFGYLSPTRASHVAEQLGERVDFIVDGGRCEVGVESTVLDLTGERPTILRPGGMEAARIEALIGPVESFNRSVALPTAPGQLASHYAPRAPLYLYDRGAMADMDPSMDEAALFFDGTSLARAGKGWGRSLALSESGDPVQAAAALFHALHELDASGVKLIRAERAPDEGLGHAINDRLFKASEKS